MQIKLNDWNLHEQIFQYIWGQSLNKYLNIFWAQSKKNMENMHLKDDILGKTGIKQKTNIL